MADLVDGSTDFRGVEVSIVDGEVFIQGNPTELLSLAERCLRVAEASDPAAHAHIDDFTDLPTGFVPLTIIRKA
ncbi:MULTISPECIES: hypothetical protein [unclassified Brevundimonas]|uniref:Imm32 family immunity protein n=1 Tax=unclassified Brevundimonas TaxID=2622653 RepID=UPI0010761B19|nr:MULTISPECIES: hypothetical protein [unclassified Brevundimonas]QBX37668.1 hypothetical protein E4M01_07710 [Brevundimonas sp. MF30-B]